MNQVLILGAGGHAKVVADLVELAGYTVAGFLDDHPAGPDVFGKPVLGPIADCLHYPQHAFVIGIGSNRVRLELAARWNTTTSLGILPIFRRAAHWAARSR